VDVKAVEAIYRNAKRLNYFLNTSSKARRRLESDEHIPAFRDQVILSSIPDLCHSLFQKDYHTLSIQEKKEIMRQIRFRFCADVSQIARVCGFSYADAARLLDSI
jgi:hypothetical protein